MAAPPPGPVRRRLRGEQTFAQPYPAPGAFSAAVGAFAPPVGASGSWRASSSGNASAALLTMRSRQSSSPQASGPRRRPALCPGRRLPCNSRTRDPASLAATLPRRTQPGAATAAFFAQLTQFMAWRERGLLSDSEFVKAKRVLGLSCGAPARGPKTPSSDTQAATLCHNKVRSGTAVHA